LGLSLAPGTIADGLKRIESMMTPVYEASQLQRTEIDVVSTTPQRLRRFQFTKEYDECWLLLVDVENETASLAGDEVAQPVLIADDRIHGDVILSEEEEAWVASTWQRLFGRSLAPSTWSQLAMAIVAAQSQGSDGF
jgi:hypothetical protein